MYLRGVVSSCYVPEERRVDRDTLRYVTNYAIDPTTPYVKWSAVDPNDAVDRWRLASELYFADSSFNCLRSLVTGKLLRTAAHVEAEMELLVGYEALFEEHAEDELGEYYAAKRTDTIQLLVRSSVPYAVATKIMNRRDNVFLSNAIAYSYGLTTEVVEVRHVTPRSPAPRAPTHHRDLVAAGAIRGVDPRLPQARALLGYALPALPP
jgi:hypothetical protein